jgi:hypothetical protein
MFSPRADLLRPPPYTKDAKWSTKSPIAEGFPKHLLLLASLCCKYTNGVRSRLVNRSRTTPYQSSGRGSWEISNDPADMVAVLPFLLQLPDLGASRRGPRSVRGDAHGRDRRRFAGLQCPVMRKPGGPKAERSPIPIASKRVVYIRGEVAGWQEKGRGDSAPAQVLTG